MPEQTIADGLQRIINAKSDIDGAIEAKGGTVTKGLENSDDDIMTITNQYTQADEGKVVSEGNLIAQTAMPDEITENGTVDTTFYNSVTVNVPSSGGGSSSNDVNFYDYDGTIVQSYSANDFANLTAMPENPTHEGLTAQGWNWSLSDAKTYVAKYSKLDIGQMYITSDGKTRLYISLPEGRTSPILQLYLNANSELDIDWGDGSTHSTFTTDTVDFKSERHEYSTPGDYVITITVVNGGFRLQSSVASHSSVLWNGNNSTSSPDRAYNNAIKKLEIGGGVTSIGSYAFSYCSSLSSITIPSSVTSIDGKAFNYCASLSSITIPEDVTSIGSGAFANCSSLSSVTIPDGVTSIGSSAFSGCLSLSSITIPDSVKSIGSNTFYNCYSLSSITIPNNATIIDANAFQYCYSLASVTIPDSVTSIGNRCFYYCHSLSSITIPDSVKSIGSNAFRECSYMSFIKFESTTPPTVANSEALDPSTSTKILVPVASYNAYITGTNYPAASQYTYLAFGTYTSGASLPEVTPDNEYSLVWYASMADAVSETNPITVGNGNEVYARATAIVSVSRYVDFPNNTTTLTGDPSTHPVYMGINRCNVSDDGTINAYYGDAGYTEDGSNGQVMVKIPKFYYKVTPDSDGGLDGVNIRKCTWEISDTADDGFTLHPAFYDANGNEIDYFLYGAFDGVGQRDSAYGTSYNTSTDKLSSVAGSSMLPTNNFTRATARTMATNRGTGWYSVGVKQTMAVQMLMAVEYGFNSQIGIGQGVVGASAATYAGQTVGNVTSGTQDNKTTPVNWRGIENFWGNIWDWIDGLNVNNRIPYFCNSYTFVDDTATGYTQISFSLPSTNYITAFGYDSNNPWVLLPSESGSSNPTGPIGDSVISSSGWLVARLGGHWADDSNAGAFYWVCSNRSSSMRSIIGARVMFIPSAT